MFERLLLAAAALVMPAAASAAWHEASSAHFVVYSDDDPEKLRAFATKLERFDKALRQGLRTDDQPVGDANRLNVYVVSNIDAVQRLIGGGRNNVAGFYVGRASGSVAFVPRRTGGGKYDLNADTIFFHEYAHHFMLANFSGAFPAWFTEGFAEFNATARMEEDGGVGLGIPAHHRAYGAMNMGRLPLTKMLSGAYDKLSMSETESLYGRGWLLTHYLTFTPGRQGQLASYLNLIDNGKPAGEAATTAFGDLKALDRELDRYVKQPRLSYRKIPVQSLPIAPVTVRALRAGEAAFMPVRMRSVRGVDAKTALGLVSPARLAARAYPRDAVVQSWLAEVEYDAGNLAQAEAAADRALVADPKNGNALIYKGRIKIAQAVAAKSTDKGVWRDARKHLVDASRADTEDAEPKLLYHASFAAEGAPPTRNAVEALVFAQQLVPQDAGLRMQVVRQHLVDGKVDDARRLLGPVAYDPHAGTGRDAAARIMARLVEKDAKGALAIWDERALQAAKED